MSDLRVNDQIVISESELEESFIHSSGPGGQNVNKVASAVQLRFCAATSASIPDELRQGLRAQGMLTRDGALIIKAQRFRERERNREDARARLAEILRRAARPRPKRRWTKVPKAVKQKRLEKKRHRARTKHNRKRQGEDI